MTLNQVKNLLDKRCKCAEDLMCLNSQLADFVEENNIKVEGFDMASYLTGFIIYTEPRVAQQTMLEIIEEHFKGGKK